MGPNGQFHHEIRDEDFVTYGCYGYVNDENKLLVTTYYADANGYHILNHGDTVEVTPPDHNHVKDGKSSGKLPPRTLSFKDLPLPQECGKYEGGIPFGSLVTQLETGEFAVAKAGETVKSIKGGGSGAGIPGSPGGPGGMKLDLLIFIGFLQGGKDKHF